MEAEGLSCRTALASTRGRHPGSESLDSLISDMSSMEMGSVVAVVENVRRQIMWPKSCRGRENAAMHLVARLFTDAVFNQDVRAIATIIQRVDGGLPTDVDAASYRTEFSDCVRELMSYEDSDRLTVKPTDTVMMALCKSLYDIAVEDIYWDDEKGRPCKPSDVKKQLRDNAMRIILERAGGRKTKVVAEAPAEDEVELTGWVAEMLPQGE